MKGMESIRQELDSMKKNRRGLGVHLYPERKRGREEEALSQAVPLGPSH